MPREWYDRHSANKMFATPQGELYRRIVADKKPYFMRYIYPTLMKQYNTYIKNTERNALREFQMTISELKDTPIGKTTERQREFLKYYDYRMPVGVRDCVMNKICRRFENEFDGHIGKHNSKRSFDYTILKSDAEYTPNQYNAIKRLYEDYNKRLISYSMYKTYERVDSFDSAGALNMMNEEFRADCEKICPNSKALCNIILDICYSKNATKRFAWNICGSEIIDNLLQSNDMRISFPTISNDGDCTYCGIKHCVESVVIPTGGIE